MLVFLFSIIRLTNLRSDEPIFPVVRVTGSHEIKVVPDRMMLAFGIESTAKEVKQAVADNQDRVRKVVEYLKSTGFDADRIQTNIIQINAIEADQRSSKDGNIQQQRKAQEDLFDNAPSLPEAQVRRIGPVGFRATRRLTATSRNHLNICCGRRGL